ncbi:MAG TPA: GNAT family N-acetyltransferase [Actinopolymorphaceae bacterium]
MTSITSITGFTGRLGAPAGSTQVVDLWNRSLPADPIDVERFRNLVLLDPNFDPDGLRLAWDGERLIGAAYAVRRTVAMVGDDLEPDRGWLPFFFVAPEARGHGVGRRLLGDAVDWLRGHGRHEIYFASYTPNYILPGLDRKRYPEAGALLEQLGFGTLYQAAAMDLGLVGYAVPEKTRTRMRGLEESGYSFGTPSSDELVPLIRLAYDHFNPDWARAIREAVLAGLPLGNIVVARDPSGEIVGWGMFAAYEGVIERFGPFGVLSDRRGLGLGEVLLHLCLERMRGRGAHSAWFLWTGEQTPAGHLYRKTGFTTTRVFDVMRASLAR